MMCQFIVLAEKERSRFAGKAPKLTWVGLVRVKAKGGSNVGVSPMSVFVCLI